MTDSGKLKNGTEPTGWAILTVDTADSKLHNELNGFISNLERIALLDEEPSLSDRSWKTRDLPMEATVDGT
jgi:hypothetical protein